MGEGSGGGGIKGSGMDLQHFCAPRTGAGMQGIDGKGDGVFMGRCWGAGHNTQFVDSYSHYQRDPNSIFRSAVLDDEGGGGRRCKRCRRFQSEES